MESIEALKPVISAAKRGTKPAPRDVRAQLVEVTKRVKLLRNAGEAVRATPSYGKHIALLISRVEDM